MFKKLLLLFTILPVMMLMTGCNTLQIKNDTICRTIKFDWKDIVDSNLNEQNRANLLLFYCLCERDTDVCK